MCHPECRWACDDPTCLADCKYVTETPSCICDGNTSLTPNCYVFCPPDQCESENCPACETRCQPVAGCTPLCLPPVASWACRKPKNCIPPRCELNCEMPACAYTGTEDPWKKSEFPWWIVALVVLILLFFR